LGLRVVNKRADGYHNLESIFQEISLGDVISLQEADQLTVKTDHPSLPVDENNLCSKVFRLLSAEFGIKRGLEIFIHKRIPLGAGLGGGSSNAATCLKAINEIFRLNLSIPDMLRLAARIGSDVPFFILGKTALVKGRGEVVIPISFLKEYQILLVYPGKPISTSLIFNNFEIGLTKYKGGIKFEAVISRIVSLDDLQNYLFNDLEDSVLRTCPEIIGIKERLKNWGARYVSLSGSGSTVYGLFDLQANISHLEKEFPASCVVFTAQPR
jgi:4-diphosphocytidyl-2-C-methyl-D-erythritol kinase